MNEPLHAKPTSWWTFVNSPFGLWLLGSIAVALITWGFGVFSALSSKREERKLMEEKIYSELFMRFEAASYEVGLRDPSGGRAQVTPDELARLAQIALENINGRRTSGFQEFHEVPATALLSQLKLLEGSRSPGGKLLDSWLHWEVRFRDQADPAMQHDIIKTTTANLFTELTFMRRALKQAVSQ
jgi:hypothetical protein